MISVEVVKILHSCRPNGVWDGQCATGFYRPSAYFVVPAVLTLEVLIDNNTSRKYSSRRD